MTTTQYRSDLRIFLQVLFWLLVLLSIVIGAQGVLGLQATISAPATIPEGSLLTVQFGSDDPLATYELLRDGVYLTNAAPYEWQTTLDDAGLYTFQVTATSGTSSSTATLQIEVLDVPLSFTVEEPAEDTYATSIVPIKVTPNATVDLCYTIVDGNTNALTRSGDSYLGDLTKPDGVYTVTLKCKRGAEIAEQSRTVLIDTTPPAVVTSSPANGAVLTAPPTVSVTTDEVASCTLWKSTTGEQSATTMQTADRLTHTLAVSPGDGQSTYLVRCTDVYGNAMTAPTQVSFTLDTPPTASVDLQGHQPLRAGMYGVILTVSEPVLDAPVLTYAYQEGGGGTIALEKRSSTEWRGYFVVTENAGERAGSFSFRGVSLSGVEGTTITDGKLFRIDTVAPARMPAPAVTSDGSAIFVDWSWDGPASEKVTFHVYRSESHTVTINDEIGVVEHAADDDSDATGPAAGLAGTSAGAGKDTGSFVDHSATAGTTYYYAVAAEDAAGNLGELSPIAEGVLVLPPEGRVADGVQAVEAEQIARRLDQVLLDIDAAYDALEKERDEETLLMIKEIGLLEGLAKLKAELKALQREMAVLPSLGLDDERFHARITATNERLGAAYTEIPRRVVVDSSMAFEQPSDMHVQNRLLSSLIGGMDAAERSGYQEDVRRLNDEARISGRIVSATITYADRSERSFTYISKEVVFPARQQQVTLYEYIPKELAEDVEDITFTPSSVVVERDPVVSYAVPAGSGSFSFSYLLPTGTDLATGRSVRTVLFPERVVGAAGNSVTGEAVIIIPGLDFVKEYWIYIIGVILIGGLLLYYLSMGSDPAPVNGPPITTSGMGGGMVGGMGSGMGSGGGGVATQRIDEFFAALTQRILALPAQSPKRGTRILSRPARFATIPPPASDVSASILSGSGMLASFPAASETGSCAAGQASSPLPLDQLLENGHRAIDAKEYIPAREAYSRVLEQMDDLPAIDEVARRSADALYYKLLLYRKMQAAVEAATMRDGDRLTGLLSELRTIATKVPEEETTLILDAKQRFRELVKAANRLAIEQEDL